ncbi:MAG: DUF2339 domain-containing protein [Winogradskyella arenosi]
MSDRQELINKLIEKLELLFERQAEFTSEINSLKEELYRLQSEFPEANAEDDVVKVETPVVEKVETIETVEITAEEPALQNLPPVEASTPPVGSEHETSQDQSEDLEPERKSRPNKFRLESFIGENLLNKIGILITVIGVAIGAKYSIENNLISPSTRIILGYLMAIGLLGFGIKLKAKFTAFSAVLVSGAMVILYFITFFAYSFYDLISQGVTFALMVVFTLFTVVAAINYNKQIIAHLGLVGAYAVPFLLSDGSGRISALLSYMVIINLGIVVLSFKKYWKALYLSAFVCTWLIYAACYFVETPFEDQLLLGLSFPTIFFLTFYVTFLAFKMLKTEALHSSDVVLLLLNSFLFYGFGYMILEADPVGQELLGIFSLVNALIHFIVSYILFKKNLGSKNLFYLASAMVLVFITITIPVQLNGNWVTLLWVTEAALLFWLGRTKSIPVYEKLAFPLILLAFLSLIEDWSVGYSGLGDHAVLPFIFNLYFLTSVLFIAAFGSMVWLSRNLAYPSTLKTDSIWIVVFKYGLPCLLLFTIYYAFRLEIASYWNQLLDRTKLTLDDENIYSTTFYNHDLMTFKTLWVLNYSLGFVAVLALVNLKVIKNEMLQKVVIGLSVISIFTFLTQGLYALSELRTSYLEPSEYFISTTFNLWLRYICYLFLAIVLWTGTKSVKDYRSDKIVNMIYDLVLHIALLWCLSSELIHWMDVMESGQSYKLGLSILWGLYSFVLIVFGLWKDKVYLRIGGIGLFALTLLKLFFYDISHLNTISKTIVFVSLGLLLLIVSFLYNKYKSRISHDNKD